MTDPHPIVERLADHSNMLATLTDIIDNLSQRIEALEQLQREDELWDMTRRE